MTEVRREPLHEGECLSCLKLAARVQRAETALRGAWWTYLEGAEGCKPPLGPSASPLLQTIDELQARVQAVEREKEQAIKKHATCHSLHLVSVEENEDLKIQLADMTRERDEAQQRYEKQCEGTMSRLQEIQSLKSERDDYKRKLAEAQGRVAEVGELNVKLRDAEQQVARLLGKGWALLDRLSGTTYPNAACVAIDELAKALRETGEQATA